MEEIHVNLEDLGFPNYLISNHGRLFNIRWQRYMVATPSTGGDLTVALSRDGKQHRFSLRSLVAKYFVPGQSDIHNTVMILDGDQTNLRFDNLVWRPRWFVREYNTQREHFEGWHEIGPILEVQTNQLYESYIAAALENGLLVKDVVLSTLNDEPVFPTGQLFAKAY